MDLAAVYDEVLYPSGAFEQSHPERLFALARLFGMNPAPIRTSRVLELGCAMGRNLLPMAALLPEASFVGVDLSERQISFAKADAEKLGLKNIHYLAQDLCTLGKDLGSFDYIVAHGVFSWVPTNVQEHLLRLCGEVLRQEGVAYLSYNTLPGWLPAQLMRGLALFHNRCTQNQQERAQRTRELVAFLGNRLPQKEGASGLYKSVLLLEHERLSTYSDTALLHDELEVFSQPIYFYEFMSRAQEHGLQFLAESLFAEMHDGYVAEAVRPLLDQEAASDVIAREQYRDILRNRRFRETLLCRKEVPLSREVSPLQLLQTGLYFESLALPKGQLDLGAPKNDRPMEFSSRGGNTVGLYERLPKLAMYQLCKVAPRALSLEELQTAVQPDKPWSESETFMLGEMLLGCYTANLIKVHGYRPPLAMQNHGSPKVSPLLKLEIQRGTVLTNLWHRMVDVGADKKMLEQLRLLIPLLDGQREPKQLLSEFAKALGLPKHAAARPLEEMLHGLFRNALLLD